MNRLKKLARNDNRDFIFIIGAAAGYVIGRWHSSWEAFIGFLILLIVVELLTRWAE